MIDAEALAPFWTRDKDALSAELRCGIVGLSAVEAAARLEQYGPNADAAPKRASVAGAVWRRLLEPLSLMLLAAGIVSAATGDAIGGAIIVAILVLSIGLDTFQEGRAVKAAEALRRSVALKAEVKRDGAFVPSRSRPSCRATSSACGPATSSRPTRWCWRRRPSPPARRR